MIGCLQCHEPINWDTHQWDGDGSLFCSAECRDEYHTPLGPIQVWDMANGQPVRDMTPEENHDYLNPNS